MIRVAPARYVIVVAAFFALTTLFSATAQELPGPAPLVVQPSSSVPTPFTARGDSTTPSPITDENYRLGTGDRVRITVYGEDDLGGQFKVDGSGQVQLPLVGQVKAATLTIHEFVEEVVATLSQGYLKDPKVSVEVLNYRPFFIIGEVNKPGEYPYENGLNILEAVALAGGYTYRANDNDIYVRRAGFNKEDKVPAETSTKIYPGDIIRVAERLF